MNIVEMIKLKALDQAAKATNVAEILIRNGLVSRTQVRDLCVLYGATYERGGEVPEDVLIHLAVDAGVGLRNVRLSMHEDHVPLVTTTPGYTHPLKAYTDGFWGTYNVRCGNGQQVSYPISESHRDALASTLMTEGFPSGLSAHYPGFLAFLTLDARLVFINRRCISRAELSPSEFSQSYIGEQQLDLLSTLGWIADGWPGLARSVASPMMEYLLTLTGSIFDENGLLVLDESEKAKFPDELIRVRLNDEPDDRVETSGFDLNDFDQSMSNGGDFLVLSTPTGNQRMIAKSDIWAVELPTIYFPEYVNALESSHYLHLGNMPVHL
jgi:hypothetical protein